MLLKFVTDNDNVLRQVRPQTSYRDFASRPGWRTSVSQTPSLALP